MSTEEIITPELEILQFFNEVTGRRARPIKSNITAIKARLKDGFTIEEIKKAIIVKTIQWKNDPQWSKHLCIETIFRPKKLEKYVNEALAAEQNPEQYRKYYEQFNKAQRSAADDLSDIAAMYGD